MSRHLNAAASAALQPKDQSATADVESIYNSTCQLSFAAFLSTSDRLFSAATQLLPTAALSYSFQQH